MVDSIYCCSVGHKLNGEKNTKKNFKYWFNRMFMNDQKHVLFSMEFPDGEWLCKAVRTPANEYDYMVPDTREEEYRFFKEWLAYKGK